MPAKVILGTSPGSADGNVKSSQGLSLVIRLSRIMTPLLSFHVLSRNCARSPAKPLSTFERGSGSTKVLLLIDLSKRPRVGLETTLDRFCKDITSCFHGKFGTFRIRQQTGLVVVEHVETVKVQQVQAVIPGGYFKQFEELKLFLCKILHTHDFLPFTVYFFNLTRAS
ncbi:hypothetical protein [Roseibium album]|uniref:hypothetical protein n=1 Tax=Roseibium album TaxID=311410 RepID=UPI00163E7497|nr:hypothetical protein [Roseibium album]